MKPEFFTCEGTVSADNEKSDSCFPRFFSIVFVGQFFAIFLKRNDDRLSEGDA